MVWAATKHAQGCCDHGGIARLPTPTFHVGQAITFHLIILNQIICVSLKCLFQKGFVWKHPATPNFSHKFIQLQICLLLLTLLGNWGAQLGPVFYFFPQECTYITYLLHLSIFSFTNQTYLTNLCSCSEAFSQPSCNFCTFLYKFSHFLQHQNDISQ